jgi:hypothetical protein
MLRLQKHEVSNYFANMGSIHIYNHLTNQLINDICTYCIFLDWDRFNSADGAFKPLTITVLSALGKNTLKLMQLQT